MTAPTLPATPQGTFHHEAFFYRDDEEYLAGTVPFIEDGLAAGEAVLVAVPEARLGLVAGGLARADRAHVGFVAMEKLGRNPAWIIPAWARLRGRQRRVPRRAAWYRRADLGRPIVPGAG